MGVSMIDRRKRSRGRDRNVTCTNLWTITKLKIYFHKTKQCLKYQSVSMTPAPFSCL